MEAVPVRPLLPDVLVVHLIASVPIFPYLPTTAYARGVLSRGASEVQLTFVPAFTAGFSYSSGFFGRFQL
jgi:hypothetical protein